MPPRHTRPAPIARGPVAPVHRGPQAATLPATVAALPYHAPNAALLIDFDNVTMGIQKDLHAELRNLLSSEIIKGKVSVQRAYADWRRYPSYIVPLTESSIDLIFAPAYGSAKKNATDIRLAIDAMELVFTRPEIGTFILLSGDSDFSSLVIKLKEYGKYVIGVGIRESSSDLLVQNCDEYYSYNTLAGLVNTREEEAPKWDPWELAGEAVQRMKRNGDVMRADRLKQVMQQIDSSFDEKNLGMSKFTRFVQEAAHRGLLSVHKMDNGQLEVDLPRSGQSQSAAPGATEAAAPAAEAAEAREPRERSRRGRGGRGREGRGARTGKGAPTDQTTEQGAPDHAAPEMAAPEAPTSAPAEAVGISGLRLTRDEAFDLVRRAVAAATTAGRAAHANDVRRSARELLGRDSESLSERNFSRILQDASDNGVVDLRGNEVNLAAAATPVAEQVGAMEQSGVIPTPTPPTRGMGPRGMTGRGRGGMKSVPLPADLLSVGVVDLDRPIIAPVASTPTAGAASSAVPSIAPGTAPANAPVPEAVAEARPARGRKGTAKKGAAKNAASKTVASKNVAAKNAAPVAKSAPVARSAPAAKSAPVAKTAAKSARKKTARKPA